jgi:hypothetical protein
MVIHYLIELRHHIIKRTTDSALAIKKADHKKRLFLTQPDSRKQRMTRFLIKTYGRTSSQLFLNHINW